MSKTSEPGRCRRGAASIALVVVLIIIEFAIVALVVGGTRDQDLSVARVNSLQAFYAAEAGVNLAIRELIDDTDHDGNGEIGSVASTTASENALHGAVLGVSVNTSGSDVTLSSLGVDQNARHSFSTHLEVTSSEQSGGIAQGVAVNASIKITGNSRIDAIDSSSTSYSPWSNGTEYATVVTNTTNGGGVELTGSSRIHGDLYVGVGGDLSSVVDLSGTARITSTEVQAEAYVPPAITSPPGLPGSQGDSDFPSWGSDTLNAGTYHYDAFETSGSFQLSISGDVTIYSEGNFEMGGSTSITLNPGATLQVYANKFEFSGNTALNLPGSPDPSLATLYQTGDGAFETSGSAKVAATVIAPDSKVEMSGNTRIFGAIVGDSIEISGSSRFTQDLALTGSGGGGGGGGGEGESSAIVIATWSHVSPQ